MEQELSDDQQCRLPKPHPNEAAVTVEERRADHRAIAAVVRSESEPIGKVVSATVPGGDHDVPVRIYAPVDKRDTTVSTNSTLQASDSPSVTAVKKKLPIIIFFHGGGWVTGDLDSHENIGRA